MKKRGQTKISFGMIFSIIMIIFFLAFAIYGIKKFMDINESAQVEKFKADFQEDVNKMWKSTQGSQELEYFVPKSISKICFEDGEFENMFFIPSDYGGKMLENVDLEKTLENSKTGIVCFENSGGKVHITIEKDFGNNLVTIIGGKEEKIESETSETSETLPSYNNEVNNNENSNNYEDNEDEVSLCNGIWEQEYYGENVYECDGKTEGCNSEYCLCELGYNPDSLGGCVVDENNEEDSGDEETPKQIETTVDFSKTSIAAKAYMESSFMITATDNYGRVIDVFFEDVSNIGFEFTGNEDLFEDVSSGRTILQTAIVPEIAYPGKYKIRAGAIPSSQVSGVKANNGGTLPSLSEFPELGFGIDEITLDVNGINYAPTIELLAEQDDNEEGTGDNPFHSGEVLLRISIVSDEGYIASYMPRWTYVKTSGSFCSSSSSLHLYAGNGLTGQLVVPPVSTKVAIRLEGTIIDGIHSVTTIRTIYVDPSPDGCGVQ